MRNGWQCWHYHSSCDRKQNVRLQKGKSWYVIGEEYIGSGKDEGLRYRDRVFDGVICLYRFYTIRNIVVLTVASIFSLYLPNR